MTATLIRLIWEVNQRAGNVLGLRGEEEVRRCLLVPLEAEAFQMGDPCGHYRSSDSRMKELLELWECSLVERFCQTSVQDGRHYLHNYDAILASWPPQLETDVYL